MTFQTSGDFSQDRDPGDESDFGVRPITGPQPEAPVWQRWPSAPQGDPGDETSPLLGDAGVFGNRRSARLKS